MIYFSHYISRYFSLWDLFSASLRMIIFTFLCITNIFSPLKFPTCIKIRSPFIAIYLRRQYWTSASYNSIVPTQRDLYVFAYHASIHFIWFSLWCGAELFFFSVCGRESGRAKGLCNTVEKRAEAGTVAPRSWPGDEKSFVDSSKI